MNYNGLSQGLSAKPKKRDGKQRRSYSATWRSSRKNLRRGASHTLLVGSSSIRSGQAWLSPCLWLYSPALHLGFTSLLKADTCRFRISKLRSSQTTAMRRHRLSLPMANRWSMSKMMQAISRVASIGFAFEWSALPAKYKSSHQPKGIFHPHPQIRPSCLTASTSLTACNCPNKPAPLIQCWYREEMSQNYPSRKLVESAIRRTGSASLICITMATERVT